MDLAVNVSGRQLMSVDFRAEVQSVLDRTGMDPGRLILEITENIFIADSERAVRVLGELRALGIRIALDDFGTGYSSLSSLRRLPIDIVKIDRSFVADIGHALSGRAIVGAATDMVHALGLTVTAEGVEDQTQQIEVTALGCDNAQGFFYARPMPAPAIAARLAEVPADCWRLPAVQGVHAKTRSEPRVLTLPGSGPSEDGARRGTEHREGALER
jgi:EAL domain-containing protein (putative c-di-GMP-specific phosphodiesterase class I)